MDGDEAFEALGADAARRRHTHGARALHQGSGEEHLAAEGERLDPGGEVDGRAHHAVFHPVAAADVAATTGPTWMPMPMASSGRPRPRFSTFRAAIAHCMSQAQRTARSQSSGCW